MDWLEATRPVGLWGVFVKGRFSPRMRGHSISEILLFLMAPWMEWPLFLGLTWLKKWNPMIDCQGGTLKFPKESKTPSKSSQREKGSPDREVVAAVRSEELTGTPLLDTTAPSEFKQALEKDNWFLNHKNLFSM